MAVTNLQCKVTSALKSFIAGNNGATVTKLEVIISRVNGQERDQISEVTAEVLVNSANDLIALIVGRLGHR